MIKNQYSIFNAHGLWALWREYRHMPHVTVDLMYRATERNDEFYRRVTREYYDYTRSRSRKFPLVRRDRYGVAVCVLPETFDEYFMGLEPAARRNFRKAERMGYRFAKIDFNAQLDDVREIWQSAEVRQGKVPEYVSKGQVKPCRNPATKTDVHDYPYVGVLKEDRLVAYAGCFVSGQLCAMEQIYGHAAYQQDGVVPMLIIGMAGHLLTHYPAVRFYTYDTFFGASETLRRFKRKFGFVPHKVTWRLG